VEFKAIFCFEKKCSKLLFLVRESDDLTWRRVMIEIKMWKVAERREEGLGFFIILLKLRMNEKRKSSTW